jgi:hypothetical protein
MIVIIPRRSLGAGVASWQNITNRITTLLSRVTRQQARPDCMGRCTFVRYPDRYFRQPCKLNVQKPWSVTTLLAQSFVSKRSSLTGTVEASFCIAISDGPTKCSTKYRFKAPPRVISARSESSQPFRFLETIVYGRVTSRAEMPSGATRLLFASSPWKFSPPVSLPLSVP